MKKTLLFFALIFLQISYSQTVTIPDANFKAALIADGVDTNGDGEIQVTEAEVTTNLNISDPDINSIEGIRSFINLVSLIVSNANFETADLSGLSKLETLEFSPGTISSINLSGLSSLVTLHLYFTYIGVLDVSDSPNLTSINCAFGALNTFTYSTLPNLTTLDLSQTWSLSSLDLSNMPNLTTLNCHDNLITSLDLSNVPNLTFLSCNQNQLTTLDVSNLSSLNFLACGQNSLETLFLKNGNGIQTINLANSPNLKYICTNSNETTIIQDLVTNYGYSNCVVNSFCTFIPGGEVFYVEGNVQLDVDNDGCDINDVYYRDLKLKVTNSNNEYGIFSTTADGTYNIALPEGSYTVEYVLENPSYFNISPTSFTVNFPSDTSPFQQDFCLTSNGIIQDLEIQIIPLELARPGFDTDYKIVYKNNGNSVVSGDVNLTYDDTVMDLVSSTPNFTVSSLGNLSWSYTDLAPLETREILVTMNLNTPMETPPLNGDEILCFEATITPITNDQRVNDNTFTLKQTVVNSYDPNDKTCLEGNTVTPDLIGEYVHYLIRFENTGTASAVNVVVKDVIDTDKFDISTMVIYDSSHDMVTRIQNTNEVEFIFEGINLPFDDANNDGYIAFKIKTQPSLVVGDTFENNAEIYFDFNFPIITNTEQTTIENTASIDDVFAASDMRIFPNPANKLLTIESSVSFDSVTIYDLKGRQLQRISSTSPQLTKQIDMTHLASGIYYVSVQSGTAKKLLKVIRE